MAGERQRQLMQKALDERLEPEEQAELRQHLDSDARAAGYYERLKQVDTMLHSAPQARAPQGLAAKIMDRLSELAEHMDPRLSRISGLALAIALGLVAGVMIPLLLLIAWLVISALTTGIGLAATMQQVVAFLAIVIGLGQSALERLQVFVGANSGLIAFLIALIPVSLIWLFRFAPRRRASDGV
jgi:anti-sigma factor RsiW